MTPRGLAMMAEWSRGAMAGTLLMLASAMMAEDRGAPDELFQEHLTQLAGLEIWKPVETSEKSAQEHESFSGAPAAQLMKAACGVWTGELMAAGRWRDEALAQFLVIMLRDSDRGIGPLGEDERDANFASRLFAALGEFAGVFPQIDRLKEANARLKSAVLDGSHYDMAFEAPEHVRRQQISELNIDQRFQETVRAAQELLQVMAAGGEQAAGLRGRFEEEVRRHAGIRSERWGGKYRAQRAVSRSLSSTYAGSFLKGNATFEQLVSPMEKLLDWDELCERKQSEVFAVAVGTQVDINDFLNGPARECASVESQYDCAVVEFAWPLRNEPDIQRLLQGLMDPRRIVSRARYEARAGPAIGRLQILIELGYEAIAGTHYFYDFMDRGTNEKFAMTVYGPAGRAVDQLLAYRNAWIEQGHPPGVLCAAVEIDETGDRVWRLGGWLHWQWLTERDMEDAVIDGRIVEWRGRKWLVPAGTETSAWDDFPALAKIGAREVIVAIDPDREWAR